MNHSELQQLFSTMFPDAVFGTNVQFVEMVVTPIQLHQVASVLKNDSKCRFDFLFCQTGVDIDGKLGVVYHLRSTTWGHSCVVKTFADNRDQAQLDTVSDLWPSAIAFEREIFDLLGIQFNHHPDMRRIFLDDDFKGFPLRKDFVDNINIIHN